MTLVTFQIPEDSRQLAGWLEQQLVGRELRGLVIELKAILGPLAQHESLSEICGDQLREILKRGLSPLQPDSVRRLLKSPNSLFDLQESIFIEGDDYWSTVSRSREHRQAVETSFPKVQTATSNTIQTQRGKPGSGRRRGFVWGTLSFAIAAACVFLAVSLWRPPAGAPTWGFDQPGVLTAQLPPKQYLDSLATAAGSWFKKRPTDKPALEKRLAEFRHGCDTLINAGHPQLVATDREWLRERCRVWAKKIDGHLADLKSDAKPIEKVQSEADETINALVKALKSREVS